MKKFKQLFLLILFVHCTLMSFGQKPGITKSATAKSEEIRSGYLSPAEVPNSLLILPPPPSDSSVAFQLDEYLAMNYYLMVDEARKMMAIEDANPDFETNQPFNSVLPIKISKDGTPQIYRLLLKTLIDAVVSTTAAKEHYDRARPFMYNHNYTCTPLKEGDLRENGSYPSAHSAGGWSQALVLSEIFSELSDKILVRGKEFGISRNICNAHWHSDVVAGRMMGSAVVASLHANEEFKKDLVLAKKEAAGLSKKSKK